MSNVDLSRPCDHVAQVKIRTVQRPARGCEDCMKIGGQWVHLRECLICGHVGCCDNSPGRHATKHFHESAHAIMRSFEPGEDWGWCYVDQLMFEPAPTPA
jgi:Zn-finger in ubiquitin-hydrolases and other protein